MDVFEGAQGARLRRGIMTVIWCVCAFLVVAIVTDILGWGYIGAGVAAANTITVSGHGEVNETPNLAEFTFSVVSDKSTVAAAQADATQKQNDVDAYLTQAGISSNDIQTSGYTINPQYDYNNGTQTFRDYEVRQSTTVKVRDTSKAGDLLAGVAGQGATEVSSLSFTFDDPNQPQSDARAKAIADAKAKADTLAKQLGVSIVRVTGFSESPSGVRTPMPLMYAAAGTANSAKAAAPEISTGQNTVTDDVTVTYEIK